MRIPAFIHTPPAVLAEAPGAWPLGLFGRLIEAVRDAMLKSDGARELAVMDDRMLADIGLDRSDVPRAPRAVFHDVLR